MITTPLFMELEGLRHRWGWFLGLGILMLILGTIALIIAPAATLGTVLALSWLIVLRIVPNPVAGALAWTLLFASFFTVIGIFRVIAAIRLKFPNWGWAVFDGAVTLLLGTLLWVQWPWSGLWFMGVAVGISLIFRGWSYVMLAFAIHSLSVPSHSQLRQAA